MEKSRDPLTAGARMSRDFRSVPPTYGVWAALASMRQEDIRHLLIMDGARLVGVVSNRDYRRILERAGPDGGVRGVFDVTVSEIMTPERALVTVRPDTPILDVARLIVTRKVGCLPVVDASGRPVGLLTQKDVMSVLLDLLAAGDPE